MDVKKEVLEAEKRIRKHIRETPVEFSPYLGQLGNCQVCLKLENLQISGSFKLRGAMNKILSLSKNELEKGVVTASTGNHGAAVAYTLKKFGVKGTIFLPENTPQVKIEALLLYGADIKHYGNDCLDTELFARETAKKNNRVYIPAYNDPKAVGGQGTIGMELARQIKKIDTVLVPVGGGSCISGIAGYLKSIDKNIEIIGCQPENSAVMYESIKAGRIIEMESKPTISDGTAGGIEQESITFDICKKYVDDYILTTEDEIKRGIRLILEKHHMLIEGSAALQVASFIKEKERFENKNVVLIISGSKIGIDALKTVLCE